MSPLLEKLRFKAGTRVCILDAPAGYDAEVARAAGIEKSTRLTGTFDLVHAFFTRKAALEKAAPKLARALAPGGILWLSYPKGKALATDLNRDVLRRTVQPLGLATVALVAVDDVWSAMRCKVAAE